MFNTTKIATKVIRTLKSTPISRKTISISSHSIKATNSNKSLISLTAGLVTATIGVTTATLLNLKPEWKVEGKLFSPQRSSHFLIRSGDI